MGQFLSSAPKPSLIATPPSSSTRISDSPQCPMRASNSASPLSSKPSPAQCPVSHQHSTLNPLNNMPALSQSPGPDQVGVLPTARTTSSIPCTSGSSYPGMDTKLSDVAKSKWEYPSPQQFYNALIRKGWNTPEEHIEAMVLIHNRLNEDAWAEVLKWESHVGGGAAEAIRLELAEFAGIHGELSHKARMYQLARKFFPSRFKFAPPFDRHDWIVRRPQTNKKVRYVIDYYSSRNNTTEDPEFHLDVRPALDSIGNIEMRLVAAIEGVYSGLVTHRQVNIFGLRDHALGHGVFLVIFVSLSLAVFIYNPFKVGNSTVL